MLVYAIVKGVRSGYLSKEWLPVAENGFAGLLHHLVTVAEDFFWCDS